MFCRYKIILRYFSNNNKKFNSEFIKKSIEKFDIEKQFYNIRIEDFNELYENDLNKRKKIEKIINIYDQMQYDLQKVPSKLYIKDIENLLALKSFRDVRREIFKLYQKELKNFLKEEFKQQQKQQQLEFNNDDNKCIKRSGLFDSDGNLSYGLWQNSLFTRINNKDNRLLLEKFRHAHYFGQNLFIDCSYSSYLSRHLSKKIVNDIINMILYNYKQLDEPFKIIICGINYNDNDYLWNFLKKLLPININNYIEHTDQKFQSLINNNNNNNDNDKLNKIIYFTSMEKNIEPLKYDPNWSYVLPAIPERLLNQDFLTPSIKKMNVRPMGVPVDRFIVWKSGSKRLSLQQKILFLNDIRSKNFDWKKSINNHLLLFNKI